MELMLTHFYGLGYILAIPHGVYRGSLKPGLDWTKIVFKEYHIQSAICPNKFKCALKAYPHDGTLLICLLVCHKHKLCGSSFVCKVCRKTYDSESHTEIWLLSGPLAY